MKLDILFELIKTAITKWSNEDSWNFTCFSLFIFHIIDKWKLGLVHLHPW